MIRAATAADVAALAAIWHDGWRDGHLGQVPEELVAYRTFESFVPRTADRVDQTWVAEVDGIVAGFVVVIEDEVEQLYVHREHRGTGVAQALLGFAEDRIAAGHDSAWLAVAAGNLRARRFYERMGWSDDGPIDYPAQVPGGTLDVPALRYRKRLAQVGGAGAPPTWPSGALREEPGTDD